MNEKQNPLKRGKIICTRIVKYDEISPLLSESTTSVAVERVMRLEQNEWKKNNSLFVETENGPVKNTDFFRDCFPHWIFVLDENLYSPSEAEAANIFSKAVWDIELKVEFDAKLEAYKLLKNEKD